MNNAENISDIIADGLYVANPFLVCYEIWLKRELKSRLLPCFLIHIQFQHAFYFQFHNFSHANYKCSKLTVLPGSMTSVIQNPISAIVCSVD